MGHEVNEDRIQHQIRQINSRIYELNERREATIIPSELNKIDKAKKKLFRQKDKLMRKLYPENEDSEIEFVNPELENEDNEDQVF